MKSSPHQPVEAARQAVRVSGKVSSGSRLRHQAPSDATCFSLTPQWEAIRIWLNRIVRRRLGGLVNSEDREDIIQDVCERALRGENAFDPGRGSWQAWVGGILRHVVIDRTRASHKALPDAVAIETPYERPVSDTASDLEQALAQLDSAARALVIKRYVLGFTNRELAQDFRLSEAAVAKRLERARLEMRRYMTNFQRPGTPVS